MQKVMVAMSGGVDSAVAASIIKNSGYECAGVTMRLLGDTACDKPCFSEENINDARAVAQQVGVDYFVCDFSGDFKREVIDRFISAYENGFTPNPCIDCNRYMKFEKLFEAAKELGYEAVATGHYARVELDKTSGRYLLLKGKDLSKDQSYVLYSLTQEQLSRTLFPLGDYSKEEIRKIAEENGFVNAHKKDSQDICFVPDGDYSAFIKKQTGREYPEGDYIDESGKVLGRHKGIINYTIGQRKGLGIALGKHVFVKEKNIKNNTVTLSDEPSLFYKTVIVGNVNLISVSEISKPIRTCVKLRYRHSEQPATLYNTENGEVKVVFDKPQRAPSPGQAAVFYDGEKVLGGGIILRGENND